jgi:hypothetical protein
MRDRLISQGRSDTRQAIGGAGERRFGSVERWILPRDTEGVKSWFYRQAGHRHTMSR